MPPDALKPTGRPATAIASRMISAASGVADTGVLPVDVLTKSAPWPMAKWAARSMVAGSGSSPVSMITFITLPVAAWRTPSSTAAAVASSPASQAR